LLKNIELANGTILAGEVTVSLRESEDHFERFPRYQLAVKYSLD